MNYPFGFIPNDDGSISMVTVGLEQGPLYFPGTFAQFDEKERTLVLITDNMEDGQITFNFDHVVFFSTSRLTEEDIRLALAEETES
ncbi:hypothetical protein [Nocardia arthritidis]|uniref:Uncharacterized protein n=1 Tax=Nocardia arthritidis TaxID=228602 RepID=A0A6G9YTC0_9NOCA|nr:hypothetical protein [Nocardia arthritidis]QIS16444.1 hypothetical protein F5544_43185 [Nocardia arthritidis]QIS16458.1 hypothetical protein F5544_43255 [Nocardia arthritidis]